MSEMKDVLKSQVEVLESIVSEIKIWLNGPDTVEEKINKLEDTEIETT
jgi:hypothetical protein